MLPTLAYFIDWDWLRIGPAYITITLNPVIVQVGPFALRWYDLMDVVAIIIGLWAIRRYTERKGISQAQVYRIVWWCNAAGIIGGRLYFAIQQPDLISNFSLRSLFFFSVAHPPGCTRDTIKRTRCAAQRS